LFVSTIQEIIRKQQGFHGTGHYTIKIPVREMLEILKGTLCWFGSAIIWLEFRNLLL
jgi:hypothetical protein